MGPQEWALLGIEKGKRHQRRNPSSGQPRAWSSTLRAVDGAFFCEGMDSVEGMGTSILDVEEAKRERRLLGEAADLEA